MTKILLISGSLRGGSGNSALLRTAAAIAPDGAEAEVYDGIASLPHFNPDDDAPGGEELDPAVRQLRAALAASDAVLFSTPEYAGDLPGSFKNLLDWTVGGGETYGMPVGWVNTAGPAAPAGGEHAEASLRRVLGYTGAAIVAAACARIPVARDAVGADGLVADPAVRKPLAAVLRELVDAVEAGGEGRERISAD